MKNKYPVRSCCYCKTEVPAGAGSVWKWRGRWYGKHAGCKKNAAPAPANVVAFPGATPLDTPEGQAWEEAGEATERAFEEANDRAMAGVPQVNF